MAALHNQYDNPTWFFFFCISFWKRSFSNASTFVAIAHPTEDGGILVAIDGDDEVEFLPSIK